MLIALRGTLTYFASFVFLLVSLPLSAANVELQQGTVFHFGDSYATFDGKNFVLGNLHIQRSWVLKGGELYPNSFQDKDSKTEWIGEIPSLPSPTAIQPEGTTENPTLYAGLGRTMATEEDGLLCELHYPSGKRQHFQLFPDISGIRMWTELPKTVDHYSDKNHEALEKEPLANTLDRIWPTKEHLRLTQVVFHDRTDEHNELVHEEQWLLHPNERPLSLSGNLFVLDETLTGDGLIYLKEAPEPTMRPVKGAADFWIARAAGELGHSSYHVAFLDHGSDGPGSGYRYAVISFHGGKQGMTHALHQYQRSIRTYVPERDGLLLSNTWGDRFPESHLTADFIQHEMDSAAKLGIEIMQVDEGWQEGTTQGIDHPNGIWDGYWEQDPHFWEANSRIPFGVKWMAEQAHARHMKFGIWFGPDSYNDFTSWKRDADAILKWHAQDQVDAFKLDSVKIRSKAGEANYSSLLSEVIEKSRGRILLDLDVTAETRQGYFGQIAAGALFVENRYTDKHRYWPHQTLRNFWMLARYIDPLRLRMEFLNPERNQQLYPSDPLAPSAYPPATLFATVMLSSPLAWFESSRLSPAFVNDVAPLIATWKSERPVLASGDLHPIGSPPDGVEWTGFVIRHEKFEDLLIFREANAKEQWAISADDLAAVPLSSRVIAGMGAASVSNGAVQIDIPSKLGFVWIRLQTQRNDKQEAQ